MNLGIRSILILFLLINHDKITSVEAVNLITFARDFIQNNIAGLPGIHQKTEWNFDPNIGKSRRVRYEEEHGHLGELAIAKLGMGIGYTGPWGTVVGKQGGS